MRSQTLLGLLSDGDATKICVVLGDEGTASQHSLKRLVLNIAQSRANHVTTASEIILTQTKSKIDFIKSLNLVGGLV